MWYDTAPPSAIRTQTWGGQQNTGMTIGPKPPDHQGSVDIRLWGNLWWAVGVPIATSDSGAVLAHVPLYISVSRGTVSRVHLLPSRHGSVSMIM